MAKSNSNDTDLLEEAVRNIREDRDLTYELIQELRSDLVASKVTHKEVGFTAAKYMETLQRSNEQLVKVIAIMKREKTATDSISISAEEADELFDIIKE
jgi:hypothetical protein